MLKLQNSVRKQTLELEVASEALALALQPLLGDINRQYFLPVIERVFDELAVEGRHIKISRLNIDLGDVPFTHFEEIAAECFYRELRHALEEALHKQAESPTPDNRSQPEEASHLELLEYYLLHGTLPFWVSRGAVFSFEELVSELAERDAAGLVRVIRKHGHQRRVVERIVLQLGEARLRNLLRLLEPAHASLIITYMIDLRETHRSEPILMLSDNNFARLVWILALTYLVQEHGSQFNRKSFVKSLLEGMAESESLAFTQIMMTLHLGLRETEMNRPLESSLPAIIDELVRELNPETAGHESRRSRQSQPDRPSEKPGDEAPVAFEDTTEDDSRTEEALRERHESTTLDNRSQPEETSHLELLEYYLLHGTLPFSAQDTEAFSFEEFLTELNESDPAGLVRVIRKHGHQRRVVERIVLQLGEARLRNLLRLLEPAHASLIITYMIDLRETHRSEPILMLSDNNFARLVWILALTYLVQEHGSQFNRKSFVKSLLEGMAESESLAFTQIVTMFQFGLRETEKQRLLESSLLAIIGEVICELDEDGFRKEMEAQDIVQAAGRTSAGDHSSREDDTSEHAGEALARLELYLTTRPEAAGESWKGRPDMRGLLRFLAAHDALRARRLIRQVAHRSEPGLPVMAGRLLQVFPPEDLLAVLAPEQKELIARFVGILSSVSIRAAQLGLATRIVSDSTLWKMSLEYLLSEPLARWNLRAMVRQAVEAVAERIGMSPVALAEMVADAVEQTAGRAEASLAQAVESIRQALYDRSRPARYVRPIFARYDHVEVLSYYLRYGILPWSALLRDHELTAAVALASLPSLSRSLLCAIFSLEHSDEKPLLRALRMMPEESLARLLLRLLPQAKDADNPFRLALSTFAGRAEDKHAFYAHLITAILDGRPFDLEELAASASVQFRAAEPVLSNDLADWEAHLLKSAIATRLRFGDTSGASEHTQAVLLHALVATHPEDARHFCRALRDTPDMLSALVQQCPTSLFGRLLELLCSGESRTLDALMQSIAGVPAPYSPSEEDMRRLIFYEALCLEDGRSLTDIFFVRLLRNLFGRSLPDEARQHLLREVVAWAASDELPIEHVTAFEAALTAGGRESATATRKSPALRDAVFTLLLGEGRESHIQVESREGAGPHLPALLSDDALRHTLTVMLEESTEEVYDFIIKHVADSRRREHWVKILPESALARLSYLLEPRKHRTLLDAAEVLASAWLEAAPQGNPALSERQAFWSFLLEFLARKTETDRSVERLVADFFEYIAARYGAASAEASDRATVGNRMLEHAGRIASATGHARLHAILHRDRKLLLAPWDSTALAERVPITNLKNADKQLDGERPRPRARQERGKMAFSMAVEPEEEKACAEPIYIDNAGLVLTAPFLPHLFQTLNMLHRDEDGRTRLRDQETSSRAVHLLQYLVDGCAAAPEPLLVMNKILCGMATSAPIERKIEPTDQEQEVCERLLKSMIANWKIISNTSIAGLQETFFRREGRLKRVDEGWKLRVQRKTVDVLVDQIPWSISVVYHRWMPQPLYVDW